LSVDSKRDDDRLTYKEMTILCEAEYHNQSPIPSITPEARPPPQHGGQ
jgi:hypothetical protein